MINKNKCYICKKKATGNVNVLGGPIWYYCNQKLCVKKVKFIADDWVKVNFEGYY
jgi:hypothetical protein